MRSFALSRRRRLRRLEERETTGGHVIYTTHALTECDSGILSHPFHGILCPHLTHKFITQVFPRVNIPIQLMNMTSGHIILLLRYRVRLRGNFLIWNAHHQASRSEKREVQALVRISGIQRSLSCMFSLAHTARDHRLWIFWEDTSVQMLFIIPLRGDHQR